MAGPFRLPLIPIFLSYTIGIILGYLDLPFFSQAWILVILFLCLWIVTLALRRQGWGSWVVLGIFVSLGSASMQAYLHPRHPPSHISQFNGTGRIALQGTVDRPPHRTARGTQLLFRSSEVIVSNRHGQVGWMTRLPAVGRGGEGGNGLPQWSQSRPYDHNLISRKPRPVGGELHIPVNGRVLLFVPNRSEPFRFGDQYRFLCVLHPPRGFHNPGGFSYERTLAF